MARTKAPLRAGATPRRVVGAMLTGALTFAAVGLVALLAIVPAAYGGAALTVVTGSMEPTLRPGDIVVVRGIEAADVCQQVSVGDIVTYLPEPDDPSLITHRVVAKSIGTFDDGTTCRLLTQGDANNTVDAPVSPAQVRGVFLYGLPKLGWAKQRVRDHPTVALAVAAVVLAAWWLAPRRRTTTQIVTVPDPVSTDDLARREQALVRREQAVAVRETDLGIAHPEALLRTTDAREGV